MVALYEIEQEAGGYQRAQMGRITILFNGKGIFSEMFIVIPMFKYYYSSQKLSNDSHSGVWDIVNSKCTMLNQVLSFKCINKHSYLVDHSQFPLC